MPDKTLGAYERHETLTAADFAQADFARHEDGRIAHRAGPDLWVYNQKTSLAPVWSTCRDMAEDGGWSPVRECPDPDVHTRVTNPASAYWQGMYDDALEEVERDRDDARALLTEAQSEATRQAERADQAELDRDNALAAAEPRPVTVTDEMVKRARKRGSVLAGAVWDASVVEAMLTAALTPEPERPDGAEEIEAVLREEWTFSDEDGGGDAFGDLAQRLASRGVCVVGEEDR